MNIASPGSVLLVIIPLGFDAKALQRILGGALEGTGWKVVALAGGAYTDVIAIGARQAGEEEFGKLKAEMIAVIEGKNTEKQ